MRACAHTHMHTHIHTHTHTHARTHTHTSPDTIGIGFEQDVIIIPESAGTVSVCVSTNVTLNGTRTASAVMSTEDVTAQGQSWFCSVYYRYMSR